MSAVTAPAREAPAAATPPERPRRSRGGGGWARRAPLLPALVFMLVVTQLPFLATVVYSLRSWNLLRPDSQAWVGLANYAAVFTDRQFLGAAANTVLITASCVVVAMLLGIGLALLLDRKFRGRGVVRTLVITPFLILPVATALLWKHIMLEPVFGLVNFVLSPFGVESFDWVSQAPVFSVVAALVWQWTPFMMLLVLAGLQSQGSDVLEAGQVDGASRWQTFAWITLPHLRRYIELGVLLGSVYVVNTFDTIYMMTQGGPGTASSNLPFYVYQRTFLGFDIGQSAAMGVVVVVGTIIVATLALRLIFRTFMNAQEATS
ncbi:MULTISPECIES: carbohydrate ABC transporter permease [Nocardiopsis]|uniref:Binding-protein-dependent transport systems inner membrane component n=1 Tax=Nocardiopsis dassonvillei (strain ATCC 23218 / DSM 43111 / CIP 107115 / JCM 7437 / KCTC 9190 / NBRC 14626 / NCTC 10488 / NRRL B-5397 / IMRU 509) TaxID=446468 RepID=D7B7K2_NOCDD|nr:MULTISPECIES: sugar ABC transporter permease [Nocardiopsis]ADH69397.1 binding-protein-dependent transport systems inner membrane component [Nocardiopsis dassonvillei subsp. dassonvillei DSM 43111]APC37412.1 sugar ABC transporter permease [Nocardiopsis dassonvillei]NKY81667.1 sugar ABC transporter permease [Nocardiopsis dassonvillei]VEI89907.1 Inner membrane ABC transporter permease protein ycjO [Nocardiopsis dassonvillei]